MFRPRTIMAIGEALLRELPDRDVPVGLAVEVPRIAAAAGHRGVAIARIGQDEAAGRLFEALRADGVDVSHLQTDPDLATGREVVRRNGAVVRPRGSEWAFDNLQWDFDLTDAAQVADAVVFGVSSGNGQTRFSVDRFLSECAIAVRLAMLSDRSGAEPDRAIMRLCLEQADGAILDANALRALLPALATNAPEEALMNLTRSSDLRFAVLCEPGEPWIACASGDLMRDGVVPAGHDPSRVAVGLLHGDLAGWTMHDGLRLAARLDAHLAGASEAGIPRAWFEAPLSE